MSPLDLQRLAQRYPQLGNNIAQRMNMGRMPAQARGMPRVAPPPTQMPVAQGPQMMDTQVSRPPPPQAQPMAQPQPAPMAQPQPAPMAQPQGQPQMPWWMQQGPAGLADLFQRYNPSSQFGFASQFGMPPPPQQDQPMMGQSAPAGQPQNMPQPQPQGAPQGAGMTRGIGSLPFGSNMPGFGQR